MKEETALITSLVERPDGTKEYYLNRKLHRVDGPAIEHPDGYKEWFVNGKRHRIDGPAIEHPDGYKAWYINGHLHRLDGPAIEWLGAGYKTWWINGKHFSEAGFYAHLEANCKVYGLVP